MRIAAYLQDELTNSTDEQYDAIKNAGWNTLILGLIHVEAPNPYNNPPIYGGTLYFNGGKAFEYGEYTGTPDFTDRVNGLIKGGTIRTLLASVGGGSPPDYDFTNIQRLYETRQDPQRGAGWSSLQSNFRALRETFPSIAMIDMDNEDLYDLPSFVAFCQMIIGIGYDITFSPFSDQSEFWNPALAQLEESNPSSVKWWNLQCYGPTEPDAAAWGDGIQSDPSLANFDTDGFIVAGEFGPTENSPSDIQVLMEALADVPCVGGGFIWSADHIIQNEATWGSMEQYATAIADGLDGNS